jgi:hypothetical protein
MKRGNEYIESFGKLYAQTPKAVFAACALSFAFIDVEEQSFEQAVTRFMFEWEALHNNGIIPQKPPKRIGVHPETGAASDPQTVAEAKA